MKWSKFLTNTTSLFVCVQVNLYVYLKTLKRSLFNIVVTSCALSVVMYPIGMWRGVQAGYDGLPTFPSVIQDLLVCVVVVEFGFYYLHR